MKTARIQIIVWFFLTVASIALYKMIARELVAPELKQARLAYEAEKLQLERAQLQRFDALETERFQVKRSSLRREHDLTFYGLIGLFSAGGLALVILAAGVSRANVKRASVYMARIGEHSEIPIHQKDLHSFYPIAVNLSLAEIEASVSTAHDRAYHISRQMLDDLTAYAHTFTGKRDLLAVAPGHPAELSQCATPIFTATPTLADLLKKGTIAPGLPLVVGYDRQGTPQCRALTDLKAIAVAGWQGSGKTLSMGYLVASSILAYGVKVFIVDPHKQHSESLAMLLKPLERTGQVTIINPFDTPTLLKDLNGTLDRRLAGQEPSEPGILLVIDELARLAKLDCFDRFVAFLERCTEETRKANITFIGGSPKWTARYFKGRADIRGCMNSMLIHKTKPSQADLLLEDAHEKHLVKHLQHPGEAILVTDYAPPTVLSIPFCTRRDMETIANLLRVDNQAIATQTDIVQSETVQEKPAPAPEVISLAQHRPAPPTITDPQELTIELIRAQIQHRKAQDAAFTQTELARQAGMSASHLSRLLNGQAPLSARHKQTLHKILFDNAPKDASNISRFSFLKKAAA